MGLFRRTDDPGRVSVGRNLARKIAPHKELIWFEKSGHPPLFSEANKLVNVMVNRVLEDSAL